MGYLFSCVDVVVMHHVDSFVIYINSMFKYFFFCVDLNLVVERDIKLMGIESRL